MEHPHEGREAAASLLTSPGLEGGLGVQLCYEHSDEDGWGKCTECLEERLAEFWMLTKSNTSASLEVQSSCHMSPRYLANDEAVLLLHSLLSDLILDGISYLVLVLVHIGAVQVAISPISGHLHSLSDFVWDRLKGNGQAHHRLLSPEPSTGSHTQPSFSKPGFSLEFPGVSREYLGGEKKTYFGKLFKREGRKVS